MKYYIYAIRPENIKECLKHGLIGVKNNGQEVLKKIKPKEKFILYAGRPKLKFLSYGEIGGNYKRDDKTLIWSDEKRKKRVIYPHRAKAKFIKHDTQVDIKHILDKLSFIKNKEKYGLYFINTFFEVPKTDYFFLKKALDNPKKISTRAIGNQLHDRVEKLFVDIGCDILLSDYDAEGPDIIIGHNSKKERAKVLIQCKRRLLEENKSPDLKTYPRLRSLIDEYAYKVRREKANMAILVLSGFKTHKNIDLSKVLIKDRVAVWTDNLLEYYEDLFKKIGGFTKYQLFSDLNINLKFDKDQKFNAIKINQNDFEFFVFAVKPEWLLKSSRVIRRMEWGESIIGYQRLLRKKRIVKDIPSFLNSENWVLPNTIICTNKNDIKLSFKKGILRIPSRYGSFWVIDGQHRLYGFSNVENPNIREENKILCALFDNSSMGDDSEVKQAQIFVDLNMHAKRVEPALLLELSDILGIENIPLKVVMRLSKTKLFEGLIRGYSKRRGIISITTFATNSAIKSLTSPKGRIIKNKTNKKEEIEEICFQAIHKYFKVVEKVFREEWHSSLYALMSDKGIRGLLRLFQKIIDYCDGKINYKKIENILKTLKESNPGLKKEDFKNKYAGEGGANKLVAEWNSYITGEIVDFEPSVKIETVKLKTIQRGDKEGATFVINKWFKLLRGDVKGILMHINETTFTFLNQLHWQNIDRLRIFFGNMKNEKKCQQLLKRMKDKKYPVIFTKASKVPRGSYFHDRWLGDDKYQIYLDSDLKLDSIANSKNTKELRKWKNAPQLIEFEKDWSAAQIYDRVNFEYNWPSKT